MSHRFFVITSIALLFFSQIVVANEFKTGQSLQHSVNDLKNRIQISPQEQEWLNKKHTVRARIGYFPPYHFAKPEPKGISVDYLKTIGKALGINFVFTTSPISWKESLDDLIGERRYFDLLITIMKTSDREQDIIFTQDYLSAPWVIVNRINSDFISRIEDLNGKSVAVEKGYVIKDLITKYYPEIRLHEYDNSLKCLRSVADGSNDAYIGNLTVTSYIIQQNDLNSLKIAAPTPFGDHIQSMGIRRDWPELASLINKAMDAMTEQEKREIINRWFSIRYEYGINVKKVVMWGIGIAAVFLIILAIILFWNKRLKREIDLRKKTERLLRESEIAADNANRAKSDFLANMSHEIRTPLTSVVGMAQLLRMTNPNKEQLGYLDAIETSSQSLLAIISDILDLSKIEAGKIDIEQAPYSLQRCIKEVIAMQSPRMQVKGIDYQVVITDNLPHVVCGDQLRVRQILLNLISNAVKFTERGQVKVKVEVLHRQDEGDLIEIAISDTGIGMSKETINKVFEAFSQADVKTTKKYGGTGLGLTISRRLAELMGGRITVESQEGVGSTFYLTLPLSIRCDGSADKQGSDKDFLRLSENRPLNVLLVDDNIMNIKVGSLLLSKMGHIVTTASDGKDAIAKWETGQYEIILMDIQMPELEGDEATAIIREKEREKGGHIPIIAVTANVFSGERERLFEMGFDGYVAKPFKFEELRGEIIRVMSDAQK